MRNIIPTVLACVALAAMAPMLSRGVPAPMQAAAFTPAAADPGFAALDRIAAMMNGQANLMLRQAVLLSGQPGVPENVPQGVSFYSFSSSTTSNGACSRSIQISYAGQGLKPRMVASTSGNCGGAAAPSYHLLPGGGPTRITPAGLPDAYQAMIRPAVQYQR